MNTSKNWTLFVQVPLPTASLYDCWKKQEVNTAK
jgi:hypothetical protein